MDNILLNVDDRNFNYNSLHEIQQTVTIRHRSYLCCEWYGVETLHSSKLREWKLFVFEVRLVVAYE